MTAPYIAPARLAADRNEIERYLRRFIAPGQVVELRALDAVEASWKRPHTLSGFFDDMSLLAAAAAAIPYAAGIYITLNPVDPALISRCYNRVQGQDKTGGTTSDSDILRRRALPIDLDAVRKAGISSSDAEHDQAIAVARRVRADLTAAGWPAPLVADSGNGGRALYRIDLPVDDKGLVKRALAALALRYNSALVEVDQSLFNPARIDKLYGTPVRKGDNTNARPHRLARILEAPDELAPVSRELLEALANTLPAEPLVIRQTTYSGVAFDARTWIAKYLPDAEPPARWQHEGGTGTRWILPVCPWNSQHTDRSAYVLQFASGAMAAGCHHNGCSGRTWDALRDLFEPDRRNGHGQSYAASYLPDHTPAATLPQEAQPRVTLHRAVDVWTPRPPKQYIVHGLLAERDVAMMYAEPGLGKTYICVDLGVSEAIGAHWLGMATAGAPVLLIDEESGYNRLSDRIERTMRGHGVARGTDMPLTYACLAGFNFLSDETWFDELERLVHETGARLVILDALADVMLGGDENSVQDTQPVFHGLRVVAEHTGAAILVIHHSNRSGEYRGSSAIPGAVDLALQVSREGHGPIKIESKKVRDIEHVTFGCDMVWDALTDSFYLRAVDLRPASRILSKGEKYVLRHLAANDGEATKEDIENNADSCSASTAKNAIYTLADKKLLRRTNAGQKGTDASYALTHEGREEAKGL